MVRRARPVRERIVPTVVERLTREFKYPETDPGLQGVSILGGGGGAPTIVLAAANALDIEKAKADILCPGVNDEQFIQSAIDSLTFGGRLLFTSGTFHISFAGSANCVSTGGFSGISFEGMGTEATIFNVEDSFGGTSIQRFAFEFTDADIAVKNFSIQGGDGALGATNGIALGNQSLASNVIFNTDGIGVQMLDGEVIVDGCQFLNGGIGIELFGNGGIVTNCHFDVGGIGISGSAAIDPIIKGNRIRSAGDAIRIAGCNHSVIAANAITSTAGWGVNLNDDNNDETTIIGNDFDQCDSGAIQSLGSPDLSIIGNTMFRSPQTGTDAVIDCSDPLGAGQGFGLNIANNIIHVANASGISVDVYGDVRIAGNILRNLDGHGIVLNDVSDAKITGNLIVNIGGDGTNTFDGIILTGDSDRNMIDGNKIVPGSIVLPRYAINISAATCDCNFVVGNDGGPSSGYGTGTINDAGTNTQLFYPSHPIEGDNLFDCPPDSS